MKDREKQLRSDLMEAMLEYIEGKRTFRSVAVIGVTEQSKTRILKNKYLSEVISDLNAMAQASIKGKVFSREEIKDIFTSMLEKLLKD